MPGLVRAVLIAGDMPGLVRAVLIAGDMPGLVRAVQRVVSGSASHVRGQFCPYTLRMN
jgi:hypothetical protein